MTVITDPRAIRSQNALQQALLALLEKKPLDQITVRDITAQAGVGYATFFRHHPTKEALLDAIAAEQIRCLFNMALPAENSDDLRESSRALFVYVNEHRKLWSTLLTGGAAGTIRDEFLCRARQVAVSQTYGNGGLPVEVSVLLMVSGTIELICWWLRQRDPIAIEQMADILYEVVLAPAISAGRVEYPITDVSQ